jgi:hypothetical protein
MVLPVRPITCLKLGYGNRIKQNFPQKILPIFLPTFIALIISILCLTLYTDWILLRKYDQVNDKIVKDWIPSLSFLKDTFHNVINDNVAAIKNVIFYRQHTDQADIPSVRLSIQRNGLDILNSQILQYGMGKFKKKQRINGFFHIEGKSPRPVSINLRGVMAQHHMVWKPSLRVKLKGKKTINGFRDHLLVAPEDGAGFRNWISNALSKKWDMLHIDDHFVRLFINNKYMGLYNRMWRLDESLFINTGRLPGYYFNLEHLDKREFQRVWEHWSKSKAWGIVGENISEGRKLLNQILEVANNSHDWTISYGRQKLISNILELNNYIDNESFAKYLALLCHAGEQHVDSRHNNSFWFNPVNGKMVPILEDVNGYDFPLTNEQLHRPISRQDGAFIQVWLQNPNNVDMYIQKLIELLDTFGSAQELEDLIKVKWRAVRPSAMADINLSERGSQRRNFVPILNIDKNIESIIVFIQKRIQWIKNKLKTSRISIVNQNEKDFEVFLESYSPIIAEKKDGEKFSIKGDDRSYVSIKLKVANNTSKSNFEKKYYEIPNFYAFYKFPGKIREYNFIHSLTKNKLDLSPSPNHINLLQAMAGVNMLEIPKTNLEPVILGPGVLKFYKTKEFGKGQPVFIKPGTTILLDPQVSLIFRGPVHIEGSVNLPVKVRPLNPQKPFGTFAILGKPTQGSRIQYLDIKEGSIHQYNNLKLTGMFSVHDCPDIQISDSRFGVNFIGDDSAHFVRSKVKIKDSIFENAKHDALDWDLVDGEISNSLFRKSGNDGLDLSMGKVNLFKNRFEKSVDKCVSSGEGTNVNITDSIFYKCNIGIAVKDSSKVKILNSSFIKNKIAYNTYRKKWRWVKGGEGFIKNTQFIDSTELDVKGDKFSKLSFISSQPQNIKIEGKLILKQAPTVMN